MAETASLDGPIAKLDRARTHLRDLNKSIGAYKRSKTHDFPMHRDPHTGETVAHMRIVKPPKNPEWGLLIGDLAHNLRSALDHLVWQLVLLNEAKPTSGNQFPVISTEREYWEPPPNRSESVRDRMLAGVAEAHRTFIDLVQPYNAGDNAHSTALAHLSWFSNTDKHRVIHGALTLTAEPDADCFDVRTTHPGGAAINVTVNWGHLEDGAEVMRFRPDPPDAPVHVDASFPSYIAFGKRQFPADALEIVFGWVDRYVRSFAPIFEGGSELAPGGAIRRRASTENDHVWLALLRVEPRRTTEASRVLRGGAWA